VLDCIRTTPFAWNTTFDPPDNRLLIHPLRKTRIPKNDCKIPSRNQYPV
jgi:hypothetical protein